MQVFAKADPRVAQFYETGLVPKELWGFGEDLRKKFHTTKTVLLKVQGPVTESYLCYIRQADLICSGKPFVVLGTSQ